MENSLEETNVEPLELDITALDDAEYRSWATQDIRKQIRVGYGVILCLCMCYVLPLVVEFVEGENLYRKVAMYHIGGRTYYEEKVSARGWFVFSLLLMIPVGALLSCITFMCVLLVTRPPRRPAKKLPTMTKAVTASPLEVV